MHCNARVLLRIVVMLNDVCFVIHVVIAPLCLAFIFFCFSLPLSFVLIVVINYNKIGDQFN